MEFKKWTITFLTQIYRINDQMQIRIKQHALKMDHLDLLFERELRNWKVYTYKNFTQGKNQALTLKLSKIKIHQKESLLKEYFNMCKMVYRINSVVAYNWNQGEYSHESIIRLYNEDETFATMIKIVKNAIINLFKGTNPRHKVIAEAERECNSLQITKTLSQKQLNNAASEQHGDGGDVDATQQTVVVGGGPSADSSAYVMSQPAIHITCCTLCAAYAFYSVCPIVSVVEYLLVPAGRRRLLM